MYDIHQHNLVFLALLYTQSQFVEHLQELIKQEEKCKLNMFHLNKSSVYLPIGIWKIPSKMVYTELQKKFNASNQSIIYIIKFKLQYSFEIWAITH